MSLLIIIIIIMWHTNVLADANNDTSFSMLANLAT